MLHQFMELREGLSCPVFCASTRVFPAFRDPNRPLVIPKGLVDAVPTGQRTHRALTRGGVLCDPGVGRPHSLDVRTLFPRLRLPVPPSLLTEWP